MYMYIHVSTFLHVHLHLQVSSGAVWEPVDCTGHHNAQQFTSHVYCRSLPQYVYTCTHQEGKLGNPLLALALLEGSSLLEGCFLSEIFADMSKSLFSLSTYM